uniref:Importin N-terminal domain-containing protein n=1 Tax=Plectus sambesii TaxID=2011161 RepID=A0A914X7E8_9BILA
MTSADVAQVVVEFYTTSDGEKRKQLHDWLLHAQKGPNAWQIALDLLQTDKPHTVQYFAANCLYDTVTKRWEECLSSAEMVESLKAFLLKHLTSNSHVQTITNKMSSTLALVALHCMPDVWPNPVADLTAIWAPQPELLLRVLAEFPTEFLRVRMPLTQRGVLKSELHKAAKDIIVIVGAVLSQEDSPSIRNAAVDCVEQWLKLPGVSLDDWRPLLVAVLSSLRNDSSALARLLTVLSIHDDLLQLEQLVLDLAELIATDVRADLEPQLGDEEEDTTALIVALVQFAERAARLLLIETAKGNARAANSLQSICDLFVRVSTVEGRYPDEESISDLPCVFWTTVREEALSLQDSRLSEEDARKLRDLIRPHYALLLQAAMNKLTYPPTAILDQWNLEAKESFDRYRKTMSDTAINAYTLLSGETMQYVLQTLAAAAQDANKAEAALFVWEQMADFQTSVDEPAIEALLSNAQAFNLNDDRLANTLLRLLRSLAHLIVTGDRVGTTYPQAIRTVLLLIDRSGTTQEALTTLDRFVEERIAELEPVANEVIESCYRHFADESSDTKGRLGALRCLGFALSLRPSNVILDSLNSLLAPRLGRLQQCVSAGSSQSMNDEDVLFELSVVSTLTGSLQRPVREGEPKAQGDSPVFLVLEQSFPLFEVLVTATNHNPQVVQRICDALNSGLCSLLDGATRLVPAYCRILSTVIVDGPAAFTVAKTLFLVFAQDSPTVLGENWTNWAGQVAHLATENVESDVLEPFLAFAYQLLKKNWPFCTGDSAVQALPHVMDTASAVMASSLQAPVVKQAAMLLAALVAKAAEAPALRELLSTRGPRLIIVAYTRLQTEILTSSVEFAADILFVFAGSYPQETRQCLAEALQQSPLVASMLNEVGNKRKFREFAKRINLAARKS